MLSLLLLPLGGGICFSLLNAYPLIWLSKELTTKDKIRFYAGIVLGLVISGLAYALMLFVNGQLLLPGLSY